MNLTGATRKLGFFDGIKLPFVAGALLVRSPSLLGLALLPTAIAATVYALVIFRLREAVENAVRSYFFPSGVNTTGWAFFAGHAILSLLLFIAAALTFSFFVGLVSVPFNDFLAERTESFCEPKLSPAGSFGFRWRTRLIWIDLVKNLAAGLAALVLFVFSWVPVFNVVSVFLTFLLITFQFVSYPQTRRGMPLGSAVVFLFKNFGVCLGFGAVLSVLFTLPLVSVFVLPLAVVGGTILDKRSSPPFG